MESGFVRWHGRSMVVEECVKRKAVLDREESRAIPCNRSCRHDPNSLRAIEAPLSTPAPNPTPVISSENSLQPPLKKQ